MNCIDNCSDCCIYREYYPSKKFGKNGILILPDEKERIEELARYNNVKISIVPRLGISESENIRVIAYQLMGIEENGNTCPFLDVKSNKRSPHGGYLCKIYHDRPLACMAYPLNQINPTILDKKCNVCNDMDFDSEEKALIKIQKTMNFSGALWRYATGIGEKSDKDEISRGWIFEEYI